MTSALSLAKDLVLSKWLVMFIRRMVTIESNNGLKKETLGSRFQC